MHTNIDSSVDNTAPNITKYIKSNFGGYIFSRMQRHDVNIVMVAHGNMKIKFGT